MSWKGLEMVSKTLEIHQSPFTQMIDIWRPAGTVAAPPRREQPVKMSPRAQQRLIYEETSTSERIFSTISAVKEAPRIIIPSNSKVCIFKLRLERS